MEYLIMILNVAVIGIWIYMLANNKKVWTPPFMSGVAFILIGLSQLLPMFI